MLGHTCLVDVPRMDFPFIKCAAVYYGNAIGRVSQVQETLFASEIQRIVNVTRYGTAAANKEGVFVPMASSF